MRTMKSRVILSMLCAMALTTIVNAKPVEFIEDVSAMQAPQSIVDVVEKAAGVVGFDGDYEVAVPKKMGIAMNPINKYISYMRHPFTKNPLIVINPEWFTQLPENQQIFLLGRSLLTFQAGRPLSMQVIPYLFIILSFLLGFIFFLLLGRTALKNQKIWVRILIAIVLAGACEFLITDKLEAMILRYLGKRFDIGVIESVVEKTHDKDAAIKALENYDAAIEQEYAKDTKFWTPLKGVFKEYAEALKK